MFVRTIHDRSRPRPRWRVVVSHSKRYGDKIRCETVQEVGTAYDEATCECLKAEGELLILALRERELNGTRPLFSSPSLAQIREHLRRPQERPEPGQGTNPGDIEGLVASGESIAAGDLVWGELYSQIGWDQVLGVRRRRGNQILKQLVLARLEEPRSKRQTVAEQHAVRWAPVSLNRVYQTMDYLDDFRIDKIIRGWRQRVHLMLGGPITAVFYDTTTLAFESDREDLGELRRKGFSKDHKPHDVPVLFALLITPEGLPLGFRVYPGNKYEGHTLLEALASFRDEGFPTDMTVIADAGLCTRENQRLLRQAGYSYVLGHRLRTLGQRWHEQLFDLERYTETKVPNGTAVKLLVLYEGDQRIIVTYSAKRARKDATEREKKLATLRQQVGEQAPIKEFMKSHDSKYLKVRNNTVVELNEEAIAKEARWDGLKAVATNRDNPLPDAQLVAQYRQLWLIEDCFRAQKDDLKVRPMYHWQDRRIKAHLMIGFMAYCCVQELRFRLQQRRRQLSVKKLVRKLNQTNFPVVTNIDSNRNFILAGAMNTEVKAIMKLFGINWPKFSFELPQKK